jgi:hypothetical protein
MRCKLEATTILSAVIMQVLGIVQDGSSDSPSTPEVHAHKLQVLASVQHMLGATAAAARDGVHLEPMFWQKVGNLLDVDAGLSTIDQNMAAWLADCLARD